MIVTDWVDRTPTHSELNELVRRTGLRDQRAFAAFYAATSSFGTALLRSSQPEHRVEDLTVDAYVALWADAPRFDPHRLGVWSWVASRTYPTVGAAPLVVG